MTGTCLVLHAIHLRLSWSHLCVDAYLMHHWAWRLLLCVVLKQLLTDRCLRDWGEGGGDKWEDTHENKLDCTAVLWPCRISTHWRKPPRRRENLCSSRFFTGFWSRLIPCRFNLKNFDAKPDSNLWNDLGTKKKKSTQSRRSVLTKLREASGRTPKVGHREWKGRKAVHLRPRLPTHCLH